MMINVSLLLPEQNLGQQLHGCLCGSAAEGIRLEESRCSQGWMIGVSMKYTHREGETLVLTDHNRE